MKPPFVMSKYATKADLDADAHDYYKDRCAQLEKELDELRSACSRCTNVLCTQAGEGS